MEIIGFIGFLIAIINRAIIPLIFAVAFLLFLWGVLQYFFLNRENEEKRKEGRTFIIYGIVGFFLMMSIWGIVNLFVGTFGFNSQARPALPSFNGSGGGGEYGIGNQRPRSGTGGNTIQVNAGRCGGGEGGTLCFFTNECIGGYCRPRTGEGGPGNQCIDGQCVNGYTCERSANICVPQ